MQRVPNVCRTIASEMSVSAVFVEGRQKDGKHIGVAGLSEILTSLISANSGTAAHQVARLVRFL
jgi:hypothetical protein